MYEPPDHPYRVPFDGSFRLADAPTDRPADAPSKKARRRRLAELTGLIEEQQRKLYAVDRHAVLLVFQALDAAGKDGTIRAVATGVNPAGFQVYSFKKPSSEDLDHDFLWRTARCLPERGRIGIFNRSYYEEVLVVRVHPEILATQRLPWGVDENLWEERFRSIRDHERHLAFNGTIVLKFFLNVSREEQRRRFLKRIEHPERHWKFSARDIEERQRWDDYQHAFEEALNATSRPWAPWYAIPADSKSHMRVAVAEIVARTLEGLNLGYPEVGEGELARLQEARQRLLAE